MGKAQGYKLQCHIAHGVEFEWIDYEVIATSRELAVSRWLSDEFGIHNTQVVVGDSGAVAFLDYEAVLDSDGNHKLPSKNSIFMDGNRVCALQRIAGPFENMTCPACGGTGEVAVDQLDEAAWY